MREICHLFLQLPFAGQDCLEGGTWLGISKTGKLAILLNILSKAPEVKLKSRGKFSILKISYPF